jgi:hypothetical protein
MVVMCTGNSFSASAAIVIAWFFVDEELFDCVMEVGWFAGCGDVIAAVCSLAAVFVCLAAAAPGAACGASAVESVADVRGCAVRWCPVMEV